MGCQSHVLSTGHRLGTWSPTGIPASSDRPAIFPSGLRFETRLTRTLRHCRVRPSLLCHFQALQLKKRAVHRRLRVSNASIGVSGAPGASILWHGHRILPPERICGWIWVLGTTGLAELVWQYQRGQHGEAFLGVCVSNLAVLQDN